MIIGSDVRDRIVQMMPPESMKSMTLKSRQAADAGFTDVAYANVRRKPMDRDDVKLANANSDEIWMKFQFYIGEESTTPKVQDRLTDDESINWTIKFINIKMLGKVYDCLCIRDR